MQIIRRYLDTMDAHLARAELESQGIDAFVADENLANADPPAVWATGGVRLMVADEDMAKAGKILARMKADGIGEDRVLPEDFDVGEPVYPLPDFEGESERPEASGIRWFRWLLTGLGVIGIGYGLLEIWDFYS